MKRIYYFFDNPINKGTEESPDLEHNLFEKSLPYSETNEEIAKAEAYNGEYTIDDDGESEPIPAETTDDVLNALLGVTV